MSVIESRITPGPKNSMSIMYPKHGDLKLEWDPSNSEEIKQAKKAFVHAKSKGFMFYEMSKSGKKKTFATQIHEFNPKAERIIGSPPIVGG